MLRLIDDCTVSALSAEAAAAARRRKNFNYHQFEEPVQRMLNAIEPESYVRPHKHENPDKVEVFLCLRGKAAVIAFDELGRVVQCCILTPDGPCHGAEVPPRTWHAILSLEPGTVLFEVKQGPYDPATDKHFAGWAPPEGTEAAGQYREWLGALVQAVASGVRSHGPCPKSPPCS